MPPFVVFSFLIVSLALGATECPLSEADASHYVWDPCAPVPADFSAADMRALVSKATMAYEAAVDDVVDEIYIQLLEQLRQHVNSLALHSVSSPTTSKDREALTVVTSAPWPATMQDKMRTRLEKQGFTMTYDSFTLRVSWREPWKTIETSGHS
jgi:hypothetical protein